MKLLNSKHEGQSLTLKWQSFTSGDDIETELKMQEYRDRETDKQINLTWKPQGKCSENL